MMLPPAWLSVSVALGYLGMLFGVAWWAQRRASLGRSLLAHPLVYALSLTVYCTSWTFYGSVGWAASSGVMFLPIYLGPTLAAGLWWLLLRKMIRISKANRLTSIADFVGSRYGKSTLLGGLVTFVAVVGVVPYIALQLKAIASSFAVLLRYPQAASAAPPWCGDTTLYLALFLAAFIMVFGTRHLDATERHEGMVAAIAFEAVVKLVAFMAVGLFVTYGMYGGASDVFAHAAIHAAMLRRVLTLEDIDSGSWASLTLLSMLAVLLLPRQFQVAVVENVDERHVNTAMWLFPAYLFLINVFVLPIAIGGLLHFPTGTVDADTFVLTLPLAMGQTGLALLAFIGGVAAATGMVIVETIALSTMVCNDLVMPILLRVRRLRLAERSDLRGWLLLIRRVAIVLLLLLGYTYFRLVGETHALVEIGLVSFAAVAQFGPALLGGMFWKQGNRIGAVTGLVLGFLVWGYTLPLPTLVQSGWLDPRLIDQGPFGVALLKPFALFGLTGWDEVSHSLFWSMLANVGAYVGLSLLTRQQPIEQQQAARFVDVRFSEPTAAWRGHATVHDLRRLLGRFFGPQRAAELFDAYATQRGLRWAAGASADAELVFYAETQLAGAIGAASARVMIAAVVVDETLDVAAMMAMLDEASQVIAYSHELRQKSHELEVATADLRTANQRLRELDRLKDEFVATVTHELRTPLTSIRAFSEILLDNPATDRATRERALLIIIKESERLTRLINQVLDLAKIESGNALWQITPLDLKHVVEESLLATSQLFADRFIRVDVDLPDVVPSVAADQDRLIQVMLNLLSNAAKHCPSANGVVVVQVCIELAALRVDVCDNGAGIHPNDHELIFDKFRQVGSQATGKPHGTGLGLPISRQIIAHFGGRLWVESAPGCGATFSFTVPLPPLAFPDAAR